jgi:hypothetical protein
MIKRIDAARWVEAQVSDLRKLGFHVAGKDVARVLVEMHNRRLFAASLVVVGTLAFMAWLNELGVRTPASSTQDLDLARRQPLKLAIAVFLAGDAEGDRFRVLRGSRPAA